MTRSIRLATVLVSGALVLSGCGGGGTTTTQTTSAATSSSKQGLAPPINTPLSVEAFKSRPCDLLTPAQRATVGATRSAEIRESDLGPACVWKEKDSSVDTSVDVTLYTNPQAVNWERLFERREQEPFFEPAGELAGVPAVHINDESKAERGSCSTHLGLSKDVILRVSVDLPLKSPEYKTPCVVSDRMATLMIQNIKAGG
ncbi:DUF3558 domain-containing protein [Crossiella cryophila]|uniref:DUF3558 domain-containing protein n=1 Tax=Crossiella cryophila TaxID=43355 RepID=A0A7W7CE30_9PSEU|nr:DUF3558 domain-containing protein [Crossiella cryophila]MBB4678196.1 hypothetical protein [Crossiella cryophila]